MLLEIGRQVRRRLAEIAGGVVEQVAPQALGGGARVPALHRQGSFDKDIQRLAGADDEFGGEGDSHRVAFHC